jgi:transcriptional regulator with XRE-family HTH domain
MILERGIRVTVDDIPQHKRVRAARMALHMTQAALARRVRCTQSAISHFERGDPDVLSSETIEKIAGVLSTGSELKEVAGASFSLLPPTLAFCPNHDCPTCSVTIIRGEISVRPVMYRLPKVEGGVFCKACGTLLETGCSCCLTPLVEGGAFCVGCGSSLVQIPSGLRPEDPEEYADTMAKRSDRYATTSLPVETLTAPRHQNTGRPKKKK